MRLRNNAARASSNVVTGTVIANRIGISHACSTGADLSPIAGMFDDARGYYGVQFHPEVTHTKQGGRILSRFILDICGCEALWTPSHIATTPLPRSAPR